MAQARKAGRRLLASGLSDHYAEIFKITRLSDFAFFLTKRRRLQVWRKGNGVWQIG